MQGGKDKLVGERSMVRIYSAYVMHRAKGEEKELEQGRHFVVIVSLPLDEEGKKKKREASERENAPPFAMAGKGREQAPKGTDHDISTKRERKRRMAKCQG